MEACMMRPSFWLMLMGPIRNFRERILLFSRDQPRNTGEQAVHREAVNRQAERMLDAHGNHILRLAYSYLHNMSDAEEVLQDTLIQFLKTAPVLESAAYEKA